MILNNDGGRLSVVDNVADLLADQTKVKRHHDQTCFRCCGINLGPLDRVVSQDRHPIALGQAKSEESVGEPAGARVPLAKCHAAFEIARANPIRRKSCVRCKGLTKVKYGLHARTPNKSTSRRARLCPLLVYERRGDQENQDRAQKHNAAK